MLKDGCSRLSHLSHIKCTCWPYKNNFVKYKPFVLIFTLSRTTVLFITFFHAIKMVNNIKEGYFQNWEIRKQKQKITITPIKKNYKKIANVL